MAKLEAQPGAETGRTDHSGAGETLAQRLNRKVRRSQWAMFLERFWLRMWPLLALVCVFLLASLADVWALLPLFWHQAVIGAFGIGLFASLVVIARTPWPSFAEALRRIEKRNDVPHRPATALKDTVSSASEDSTEFAIWRQHQRRMAERTERLKVPGPEPRTYRFDPFAARAVMLLILVLGFAVVGKQAIPRVSAAFDFGRAEAIAAALRLDAWITPPTYTARAPIILADGGRRTAAADAGDAPGAKPFEVPQGSVATVRVSGKIGDGSDIELVALDREGNVVPVATEDEPAEAAADRSASASSPSANSATVADKGERASKVREARLSLHPGMTKLSARFRGREIASWDLSVTPDNAPKIALTDEVEKTRRGGMKLFYSVTDDFGVASAEAKFRMLPPDETDPRTQWARPDVLKGPRPPLERRPRVTLRLPPRNSKDGKTWSFKEIGGHPWAGMRVEMTLVARDHAGNVGTSKPVVMRLPERVFLNPLARAVIEQRRNLVIDARYRDLVRKSISALTIEPKGFINDLSVYLGLRSVYHRLRQDRTRAGLRLVIDQLWNIAVRIEDGRGLSDAERRLREIQDKLAKALERGASEKEIQELMNQLRQALNEFLNQLARQSDQMPEMRMPPGMSPEQFMSRQDLERMMRNLENMSRQGSRDAAREMLSQLRDLIDRLQSGRIARRSQQGQMSRQMMQMMDEFGNLIGRQQRLMDDTFNQRRQGQQGQQGQQGRQGQQGQGQQGQQGQGQQGQGQQGQGQQGQGQQPGQGNQGRFGQRGGPGQPGQNGQSGPMPGRGELTRRQQQLRETLDRLRRGMNGLGMRPPGQLDGARESMDSAQRALERGDLETATREQQRALDQLRQGAQQMARQMLRRMPSRFGRAGDAPLDPLGRPQRTEGPDPGSSVKVPSEIEMQRAREIIEELRRRLGETTRPLIELDYIERLLKRF
ncbi:MAG: TIGR02302 family protein [Pseudomonadota bacterium]